MRLVASSFFMMLRMCTFTVLSDGGFSDEEIIEWMFTHDDRLVGGSPIGAIHQGAKTEVRRRAMEEAL